MGQKSQEKSARFRAFGSDADVRRRLRGIRFTNRTQEIASGFVSFAVQTKKTGMHCRIPGES